MSCNPCCCLKLKDAAVTIGIWSTVYSLVQIGVFGWQFSVLAQCQHVIMAQSNLQCDYYCPCVGASTARTSAIIEGISPIKILQKVFFIFNFSFIHKPTIPSPNPIERNSKVFSRCSFPHSPNTSRLHFIRQSQIYSIMQLGIFGWQMAAIKYEKDRAANTLLPNYNTYGRYDIPTYYESYWQSPEERYYTWLFVIQILCLISAFFLLFASIMMIYGVHTWSRYLMVPWMVTMCASILTSLAYCIMWWAGDVRDYWLMLTIVEMFGVFLNTYCFVVIATFHRRMLAELEYYARRRKYDRFSQRGPATPQHTIEQPLDDSGPEDFGQPMPKETRPPSTMRRPAAGQFPYQQSPPPIRPPAQATGAPYGSGGFGPPAYGMAPAETPFQQQRSPMERFQQEQAILSPPIEPRRDFARRQQRPQSALERPFASHYDEFRQRRPSSHRHKSKCRHCGREPSRHYRCHRCQHHIDHCHCHTFARHRKYSCSSLCSTANFEPSVDEEFCKKRKRSRSGRRRRRKERWSDQEQESDFGSELATSVQSEHNYGNINMFTRGQAQDSKRDRQRHGQQPDGRTTTMPAGHQQLGARALPRAASQQFLHPQGISIPQQIVIPPMRGDGTLDSQAERQYRINSEITISYDPLRQQQQEVESGRQNAPPPPAIPPRRSGGHPNLGSPFGTIREQPRTSRQPMSITSNV